MRDIQKAALWRAIAYVYAGPLAILSAAWYGHMIDAYGFLFMAFMLGVMLLPAAGEVGIASVYQAEKEAERLHRAKALGQNGVV